MSRFAYGRGAPVLEDVDLAVEDGEFVAIAGPNGGGKTTLMRLLLGLERPDRGEALLFGSPASILERTRPRRLPRAARRARSGRAGDGP